jgi:hypothetical protein
VWIRRAAKASDMSAEILALLPGTAAGADHEQQHKS